MRFQKTALLAAVSAVALMAGTPASAADMNDKTAASDTMHDKMSAQTTMGTAIKADELVGKSLKNISGETVGDIESVIIDKNGKVAAVIVGVGGFLGVGEREVAIDWDDLRVLNGGKVIQTNFTKNALKALPEYKYAKKEYRQKPFYDREYVERRNERLERAAKSDWVSTGELRVSKLIGADVVNSQGDTVGEVDDVIVMDGHTRLVLSVGEFLGMGGHEVVLDLDKAKIDRQRDDADELRVEVAMSKDQLKTLPKFDSDRWTKNRSDRN